MNLWSMRCGNERERIIWQLVIVKKTNWRQFSCFCLVSYNEFRHNIVKVVRGSTRLSPRATATWPMLWRNSWSTTAQTHEKLRQFFNRPFARSSGNVRNKLCWDASYTVGLSKSKESRAGLVRGVFASQHNLFRTMWSWPDRTMRKGPIVLCVSQSR